MITSTLFVFDDVNIGLIPKNAAFIGVYVDGRFADVSAVKKLFPHAVLLPITVFGKPNTRICDCENGDLTPAEAARWASNEIKAGRRPMIYTSVSQCMTVVAELNKLGHKHTDVDWWLAHYTGVPHICGPQCGFGMIFTAGGTQFTDRAENRSLDESLFFATALGVRHPKPKVDPYLIHPNVPVPWKGKVYRERAAVQEYDKLRRHKVINWRKLVVARADLLALAERLVAVAHSEPGNINKPIAKPRWKDDHLGEREQALLHRAQGDRVIQ